MNTLKTKDNLKATTAQIKNRIKIKNYKFTQRTHFLKYEFVPFITTVYKITLYLFS